MKLILNIYDHSVMMHVKFHEDVIRFREVIALDCLNINIFGVMRMTIHKNVTRYTGVIALELT